MLKITFIHLLFVAKGRLKDEQKSRRRLVDTLRNYKRKKIADKYKTINIFIPEMSHSLPFLRAVGKNLVILRA